MFTQVVPIHTLTSSVWVSVAPSLHQCFVLSVLLTLAILVSVWFFRSYDCICSGEAHTSFLQVDRTSPYRVRLIATLVAGQPLGSLYHSCLNTEVENCWGFPGWALRNLPEKWSWEVVYWEIQGLFGLQGQEARVNLSIDDSPACWWPSAGSLPPSRPFLCPGAVHQPRFLAPAHSPSWHFLGICVGFSFLSGQRGCWEDWMWWCLKPRYKAWPRMGILS